MNAYDPSGGLSGRSLHKPCHYEEGSETFRENDGDGGGGDDVSYPC